MTYGEWSDLMKSHGWKPVPLGHPTTDSPPWYLSTKYNSDGNHPVIDSKVATEYWRQGKTPPTF